MNNQDKKHFFWVLAIGIIAFLLYGAYDHYKEKTIGGRISVIKSLKMSDITDAKK